MFCFISGLTARRSTSRTGALCSDTAAKLVFIHLYRDSKHVYSHTVLGWLVWITLCFTAVAIAFTLPTAVSIFSDLIRIAASHFAAWYAYGIASFFWLHGTSSWEQICGIDASLTLALLTIAAGAFISAAGILIRIHQGTLYPGFCARYACSSGSRT
jgi:hypothetical protein